MKITVIGTGYVGLVQGVIMADFGADGIVLITEWNQFRGMNIDKVRDRMKDSFYFDLRNIYAKDTHVREIFKYFPIGQK